MSTDDAARRLSEALRAQASGAVGRPTGAAWPAPRGGRHVGWALLIGLLAGGVLGTVLALLSVLVPGLLPALG